MSLSAGQPHDGTDLIYTRRLLSTHMFEYEHADNTKSDSIPYHTTQSSAETPVASQLIFHNLSSFSSS